MASRLWGNRLFAQLAIAHCFAEVPMAVSIIFSLPPVILFAAFLCVFALHSAVYLLNVLRVARDNLTRILCPRGELDNRAMHTFKAPMVPLFPCIGIALNWCAPPRCAVCCVLFAACRSREMLSRVEQLSSCTLSTLSMLTLLLSVCAHSAGG